MARTIIRDDRNSGLARHANWAAKKLGVPGVVTLYDILSVIGNGQACVYCGTRESIGVDHIIPTSRGGPNIRENLQACCTSCNHRKGNGVAAWSWSREGHESCLDCGRRDRPHGSYGRCRACERRWARHGRP